MKEWNPLYNYPRFKSHQLHKIMTYKEKKLKEFDKFTQAMRPSIKELEIIDLCKELFSSTIDEILGCLPKEDGDGILENENTEISDDDYNNISGIGFNQCRKYFLQNLDQKAGEV